jgi:hypothetical protein
VLAATLAQNATPQTAAVLSVTNQLEMSLNMVKKYRSMVISVVILFAGCAATPTFQDFTLPSEKDTISSLDELSFARVSYKKSARVLLGDKTEVYQFDSGKSFAYGLEIDGLGEKRNLKIISRYVNKLLPEPRNSLFPYDPSVMLPLVNLYDSDLNPLPYKNEHEFIYKSWPNGWVSNIELETKVKYLVIYTSPDLLGKEVFTEPELGFIFGGAYVGASGASAVPLGMFGNIELELSPSSL